MKKFQSLQILTDTGLGSFKQFQNAGYELESYSSKPPMKVKLFI